MNFDFTISASDEPNRLQIILADPKAEEFCRLHTVNRVGGRRDASGNTTHFVFPPEVEPAVRAAVAKGVLRHASAPAPQPPQFSEEEWKAAEEEAIRKHRYLIERGRLGLDREPVREVSSSDARDGGMRFDDRFTFADDPEAVYCAWGFVEEQGPSEGWHDLGGWTDGDEQAFEAFVRAEFSARFDRHAPKLIVGMKPSAEVLDLLDVSLRGAVAEVVGGHIGADDLRERHPEAFLSALCDDATAAQRRLVSKLLAAELKAVTAALEGKPTKPKENESFKLLAALRERSGLLDAA